MPDFRNLLLWSPDIKTDVYGKKQIHFYSSDQQGKYMVVYKASLLKEKQEASHLHLM